MKFDRLNQILQVAANIGVILSITFLAIELGQNQEMMRAQTRNELSQGIVGLLSTGITDPGVSHCRSEREDGPGALFARAEPV